ncbi:MAG: hypothetical protein R3F43_21075 [bacterium]
MTEVALDGRRAPLRAGETNLGDLVADSLQWAVEELVFGTDDAPADVAIMNGRHPHQPGGPGRRRHGAGHLLHAPLRQLRRPPARREP